MRAAIRTLALAATLVTVAAASAQTPATSPTQSASLPPFARMKVNMTNALGNLFGIRGLLPTLRDTGPYSSGVPNAAMSGIPDTSNSANYLKGFGYQRLGQ